MNKETGSLIETLKEELTIIEGLIDDAHKLREALRTRDGATVQKLVARRQTTITRLQMVQHAKTSILKKNSTVRVNRKNVKALILERAPQASTILEKLQDALVLLHQLNTVNDRLLTKQRASVYSYNHLVDLALGVEQTYDRKGSVHARKLIHLEQQG